MSRRIAFLALVTLLAGGCVPAARPIPAPTPAFPPSEQVKALALPLDAYSPSLAELYTSANARDRLTRDCLKAAGLDWKVIARPTSVGDYRNRRRYGVIERPVARDFGYHVPVGLLTPAIVDELNNARDNSLSPRQRDAAYGPDGCAAQAARQLPADPGPAAAQLARIDHASLTDSQRAPRVAAAMASWRNCMARRGLHYGNPFAAVSDRRWWATESAGPSPAEKSVAVADVDCKEQSKLVDEWHAAEVGLQHDLIQRNAATLERVKAGLDSERARASAVLATELS
ncbi:hypothetical protein [Actinoplanes sp. NPDC051411]|uniref:hypothetical protein n=1 Tax=Actinoplanes sp. NPDC051411 TaxID=3155522 RepID=UPI003431DBBB